MWLTEFCSVAEVGVGVGVGEGPPVETEPLPQPVNDTRETKRITTKDKGRNSLRITGPPQLNNFDVSSRTAGCPEQLPVCGHLSLQAKKNLRAAPRGNRVIARDPVIG